MRTRKGSRVPFQLTASKPVDLVYIGLADGAGVEIKSCRCALHLPRETIRDRACKTALNIVRWHVSG